MFTNKKFENITLNCDAFSSFYELSSDNRMVSAKICLSLRRNDNQTLKNKYFCSFSLTRRDQSNE